MDVRLSTEYIFLRILVIKQTKQTHTQATPHHQHDPKEHTICQENHNTTGKSLANVLATAPPHQATYKLTLKMDITHQPHDDTQEHMP